MEGRASCEEGRIRSDRRTNVLVLPSSGAQDYTAPSRQYATLELAPVTRQTVVKTVTTTTYTYPAIRLPRPASPVLTGDHSVDKIRYPLKVAASHLSEGAGKASLSSSSCYANAALNPLGKAPAASTSQLRLGQDGQVRATYSRDQRISPRQRQKSALKEVVDRKGKRRMSSEDVETLAQSHDEEAELLDFRQEREHLSSHQYLASTSDSHGTLASGRRDAGHRLNAVETSRQRSLSPGPPRKRSRRQRDPEYHGRIASPVAHLAAVLPSPNLSPMPESQNSSAQHRSETQSEYLKSGDEDVDAFGSGSGSDSAKSAEGKKASPPARTGRQRRALVETTTVHTSASELPVPLPLPPLQTNDITSVLAQSGLASIDAPAASPALSALYNLGTLVSQFGSLTPSVQTLVLHQLLKHAPIRVLQDLNNLIQPALKRDFVSDLPPEIALHILSYLDLASILSCIRVSQNWKRFINAQGNIWQGLLQAEDLWVGDTLKSEEKESLMLREVGIRKRDRRSRSRLNLLTGENASERESASELTARELIALEPEKSLTFMQQWNSGIWDEWFDADLASIPTADKIATARAASRSNRYQQASSLAASSSAPSSSTKPFPRLRRSSTRPRISRESLTEASADQSMHYQAPPRPDAVHPYKLLLKKRVAVRNRWQSTEHAPKQTTFRGEHSSVVTCLQFDNQKIVTASDDPSIEVYETATGRLRCKLLGHEGGVWALQYVGDILVSGSTDRTLRIWDLDTEQCTHVFYGHTSTVRCLQILEPVNVNPDSAGPPVWEPPYPLVITGSRDNTLRVWRLPSRNKYSPLGPYALPSPSDLDGVSASSPADNPYHLHLLRGHAAAVRTLAAHGRTLVSGSYDCTLRVWDILHGQCKFLLRGHTQKVYSVILDHERGRCASGSMDGTVRLWSVETGQPLFRLDGHSSLVGLLGLSYHYLVSAGADSNLKIWNPANGECIDTLVANGGAITCFMHDEFRIVSGAEGQLRIWDIRKGTVVRDVLENMNGVWQVGFNDRFCVAAVQRGAHTEFEIVDFFPELSEKSHDEKDAIHAILGDETDYAGSDEEDYGSLSALAGGDLSVHTALDSEAAGPSVGESDESDGAEWGSVGGTAGVSTDQLPPSTPARKGQSSRFPVSTPLLPRETPDPKQWSVGSPSKRRKVSQPYQYAGGPTVAQLHLQAPVQRRQEPRTERSRSALPLEAIPIERHHWREQSSPSRMSMHSQVSQKRGAETVMTGYNHADDTPAAFDSGITAGPSVHNDPIVKGETMSENMPHDGESANGDRGDEDCINSGDEDGMNAQGYDVLRGGSARDYQEGTVGQEDDGDDLIHSDAEGEDSIDVRADGITGDLAEDLEVEQMLTEP